MSLSAIDIKEQKQLRICLSSKAEAYLHSKMMERSTIKVGSFGKTAGKEQNKKRLLEKVLQKHNKIR